MRLLSLVALVLFVVPLAFARAGEAPLVSGLAVGDSLFYETGGVAQPPWHVDSLRHGMVHDGRDSVTALRLTILGTPPSTQERFLRRDGGNQIGWERGARAWRLQRPLVVGGVVGVTGRGGRTTRFEVERAERDTVSGRAYDVLVTTGVTRDSTGAAFERLRERYAPALGTATWGVFERADTSAASGWKPTREFRLAAIRRPAR